MMHYRGWQLTPQTREEILLRWPATRAAVRCDHVTLDLCAEHDPPPEVASIRAYGVLDADGYQVLAVTVDGHIFQPRRDRLYHVTISHDEGLPSSHAGVLLLRRQGEIKWLRSTLLLAAIPFVSRVGPVVKT